MGCAAPPLIEYVTPDESGIKTCMCKDTVPIPGAKNLKQLDDNLGALGWRLSASEIEELDRAAERVGKSVSQNVFQTA